MFSFFRVSGELVKPDYWAEKVLADDVVDRVKVWSEDTFRAWVRDSFECATSDDMGWTSERRAGLWDEINRYVLSVACDGERYALAAENFEHDGFKFDLFEVRYNDFSYRFMWCCHALVWAIAEYDRMKEQQVASVEQT